MLGGPRFVPPSAKVNVALIGAGGQGRHNIRALFQEPDTQVIAVADPAERWNLDAFYYKGDSGRKPVKAEIEKHYARTTPNFRCAEYEDFRVMLEKEKAIDAVLCATPDHLHAYVSVLAVACVFWPGAVSATTIDPRAFEEFVMGADFVGIVECEQAGGIVANYNVVESWKGPRVGSQITIRVAVNYWEPQFPIALCAERYFVTAYKEAPVRIMSTTSGGAVPLWWRKIPADYRLPLFQGRRLLSVGEEKSPDFDRKTRHAAQELLALKPAEQETALLKAVVKADFCFEDAAAGIAALRKLVALEGDPGVWAALTLA